MTGIICLFIYLFIPFPGRSTNDPPKSSLEVKRLHALSWVYTKRYSLMACPRNGLQFHPRALSDKGFDIFIWYILNIHCFSLKTLKKIVGSFSFYFRNKYLIPWEKEHGVRSFMLLGCYFFFPSSVATWTGGNVVVDILVDALFCY